MSRNGIILHFSEEKKHREHNYIGKWQSQDTLLEIVC